MSAEQRHIPVYVDFTSTYAAHPEMKETTASVHRQWLETNLDAIMDRQSRLPIMMIHNNGSAVQHVVDLLLEARQLFCLGYHYSCVAMCGIVVERIIKDILRHNVLVARDGRVDCPSEKAFDQLERVDVRSLINFVAESGLITTDVKSAAAKIGELRNQYAHARGQSPDADALKAIENLHTVVGGTVSVLKNFEIKDGVLVPRITNTSGSEIE